MTYLLDINTLIALVHAEHVHHQRTHVWLAGAKSRATRLHTCSLSELGFLRVSVQTGLQTDVSAAKLALARLRGGSPIAFSLLPDELGSDRLPAWVRKPGQLTDGHLLELARAHGAQLVTLDRGIPGALLIP